MKNLKGYILGVALFSISTLFAQQTPGNFQKRQNGQANDKNRPMVEQLNLTAEQKAKFHEIRKDFAGKDSILRSDNKIKRSHLQADRMKAVKSILNKEQAEKFDGLHADNKPGMNRNGQEMKRGMQQGRQKNMQKGRQISGMQKQGPQNNQQGRQMMGMQQGRQVNNQQGRQMIAMQNGRQVNNQQGPQMMGMSQGRQINNLQGQPRGNFNVQQVEQRIERGGMQTRIIEKRITTGISREINAKGPEFRRIIAKNSTKEILNKDRAMRQTDMLDRALDLNDKQAYKILKINQNYAEKDSSLLAGLKEDKQIASVDKEALKKNLESLKDAKNKEIVKVLGDFQKVKFESFTN